MTIRTIEDIADLIKRDPWRMEVLETVAALALPDWAIGAGFVRAAVWDAMSSKPDSTQLPDVDVLYFDRDTMSSTHDKELEGLLRAAKPDVPWSIKNQARMHIRNNDAPYKGTEDALRYWLETPTAIAVRLEPDGALAFLAPYGIDDLLAMRVRPTPNGRKKIDQYRARAHKKRWAEHWPGLIIQETGSNGFP